MESTQRVRNLFTFMSDGVQFKTTLDVTAHSAEVVTAFCIGHLRERGFVVEEPRQWEWPAQFSHRIGIHPAHFSRVIKHPHCPPVTLERGPSGRVMRIASNSVFEKFCRRNLQ